MSAVIAVKRKRLVRRFYEAGATDQDHAVTLESLGERRSWIFDQMLHHGVFSDIGDGRFFMDVELADQFLRERRFRALSIAGYLLLLFGALWLVGLLGG